MIASAIFYFSSREVERANRRVEHTYNVSSAVQNLLTLAVDAQNGVRGYALTKDKDWLRPYNRARSGIPQTLDQLRFLVRDNPRQSARLRETRTVVDDALQRLDSIVQRVDTGLTPDLLDKQRGVMERLRTLVSEMQDEEQALLLQRQAESDRTIRLAHLAAGFTLLLGIGGGLLAASLLSSGIVRRVEQLVQSSRQVAAGNAIQPEISGADEIGLLEAELRRASFLLRRRESRLQDAKLDLEEQVDRQSAELQSVRLQWSVLIEAAPIGIWVLSLDGRVHFRNPAAARMFGGSDSDVLQSLPPPFRSDPEALRGILRETRDGRASNGTIRRLHHENGKGVDVSIFTSVLRDTPGAPPEFLMLTSDITQRRSLEMQLQHAQKMEAIGRLAGGIAHDFNNLLTVIIGYTDLLQQHGDLNASALDELDQIQRAAESATRLTRQLLAFGRKQILQQVEIDLNEVMVEMDRMLRRLVGEDLEFVVVLDPALPRIVADRSQVEQILVNLVVNARDAMPNGGKLTVETRRAELTEAHAQRHMELTPGSYVMLSVSDTGIGMDEETKARIFEPFFTTKELGKGTGLGLSTIFGAVEQSGGYIWVYSELGRGSTFKIYFPHTEAGELPARRPQQVVAATKGTERILLVEDDPVLRKLSHRILAEAGYTVLDAADADQAETLARERHDIELLVTDVVMPGKSGRELADILAPDRPAMKTLYLSGYTDDAVFRHGLLQPGMSFVQKPFTPDSLLRKVREVLDGEDGAHA